MKIYKFGGASIKDSQALNNIVETILSKEKDLWIVVSAIGKTTNSLEKLLNSWFNYEIDKFSNLEAVINFHKKYISESFKENSENIERLIEPIYISLEKIISQKPEKDYDILYDEIVSYGELMSSLIFSEYLKIKGIDNTLLDARELIITDSNYRDAKVSWLESQKKINEIDKKSSKIFVTQGFIGADVNNMTTTLGREGSDYTASALAYLLDAESVTIWKDVPGIMNADPSYFDFAEKLKELSYNEAIELAFYGAKVIHPKTIKPIENKNIPLYVKSFVNPENEGTVIKKLNYKLNLIPVFILKQNQILISISPKDFSFIVEENMSKIFGLFAKYKTKLNISQNSAVSFSASIDDNNRNLKKLIKELQDEFFVKYNSGLELITIRYYTEESIDKMLKGRKILMEQRSRKTARFLVKMV
ncbi:MAG: aspartate kinase [Bacteroidota bacterium]|jgi:aspartate kinase|nr:aspartate kinase [Bacteroidales bacterium]MDI9535267.1 aspartate kinase [Bacteroidota bacterium]NLP20169.1 aspartate kinase [Bacteroidales bacterium]OQC43748.1 MAG: Lysine-sensitive aspartokinase 3 [Bacteroidetes bacterium ADurb.Bin028]HNY44308.1 aspartate kinase [Bacteroidales bacterium]